jgi:threonine/homoserine/homoserine lactone efflux protein
MQEARMLSMEFLLTSLVVVLMPGTGVIYTVSTGLFLGGRSSIAAAVGCTAGIIPHLLASILGLSAIMHISSVAFQVVKMAGAVYLLYLAWSMWRETGGLALDAPGGEKGPWKIAVRGVLINILNPKLSIFFLAFLPLFVSPQAPSPMLQMLLLSAVFMGMTLGIFILYGVSAHGVRKYIVNSPRLMTWLQRSFAATFAALGAKLAMTDP